MMAVRMRSKHGVATVSALLIVAAIGIGLVASLKQNLAILGAILGLGLIGTVRLLTLSQKSWWALWLGTVFLAAFGPFLDIVTHQPMNWLIGLLVLFFFALSQLSRVMRQLFPRREVGWGSRVPALGSAFCLYVAYFLLQVLRPDGDTWNALMAFRAPLIGLAAYFLTAYRFRAGTRQDKLMKYVCQFLTVFIIAGLVVAAYGLFQFAVGLDRLQAWGLTETAGRYLHHQRNLGGGITIFRIFSTMRRNETLGVFLYLNIVACAVAIRLRLRPRWLVRGSLGLSLVALLLALSLTSLVVLGIWVGLLVLTSRSKRLVQSAIVLGVLGIVVTLVVNYFLGGLIGARFAEHVLDTQENIGRIRMFLNWIEEMRDRPFLQGMVGSGICTGLDESTLGRIETVLNTVGIRVGALFKCGWQREVHDNWYATHSLEVGWFGVSLLWAVFALIIFCTLPRLRRRWSEPERGAWTMLALGVLALWPSGFVGALFLYMPIVLYFWSMVALLDVGTVTSREV